MIWGGVLQASVMTGGGVAKDTRYKVLWIGEIAKHKGIGETKVLRNFSLIEIPVSELKWAN